MKGYQFSMALGPPLSRTSKSSSQAEERFQFLALPKRGVILLQTSSHLKTFVELRLHTKDLISFSLFLLILRVELR